MASALKNLYNERFFNEFTGVLSDSLQAFDSANFISKIYQGQWDNMELKQRMKHIAEVLNTVLTRSFPDNVRSIYTIISTARKRGVREQSLEYMFLPEYIALYGLDHFKVSMQAIEVITQFISCEFAIRPFLLKYPGETMRQMQSWSLHANLHVRRFSSEGSRPRLPWGLAIKTLQKDPTPILPILENLKNDPSEYVRRSVANNLNDIARDHPNVVIDLATRWKGISSETDRIIKHGCRTLLRKANADTLTLWGLSQAPALTVDELKVPARIVVGDVLEFSFRLTIKESKPLKLRIEYGIDYVKALAKSSRKLFKITENTYKPGQVVVFKRRQSFKDMTTRKHYAGIHHVAIVVNGKEYTREAFDVNR